MQKGIRGEVSEKSRKARIVILVSVRSPRQGLHIIECRANYSTDVTEWTTKC